MRGFRDQCTLLNADLVDGFGGQRVRDWDNATPTPNVACSIQPATTSEDTDRRHTTTTAWAFYCPPGEPFDDDTRVEWDGLTLDVDGEVGVWKRRGRAWRLEATLKKIDDE